MARPRRIYFQQTPYHITIRGNNRKFILEGDENKISFLQTLNKFHVRFGFKLYAFVVMDNHVHLIIAANSGITISKIMHAIELSYSFKYRKKHGYTGHVWEGPFNSNVIEGDSYIEQCIDYIHSNPVRAKMVERASDYLWSSCQYYDGIKTPVSDIIEVDKFTYFYSTPVPSEV